MSISCPKARAKIGRSKDPDTAQHRLHQLHIEELQAIWKARPDVPTVASRRAWAIARDLKPKEVHKWFHSRPGRSNKIDPTYVLGVGAPPVISPDQRVISSNSAAQVKLEPAEEPIRQEHDAPDRTLSAPATFNAPSDFLEPQPTEVDVTSHFSDIPQAVQLLRPVFSLSDLHLVFLFATFFFATRLCSSRPIVLYQPLPALPRF
ncbi:hypothetical protein BKA62DRAFT_221609 [Auriculariales sp. MPI-PUGE-AT-0066]|nr:hypothetical protein BKA62DRAFT_221609 [Auriculariales sp. MPI-PUGE-AT-0066]